MEKISIVKQITLNAPVNKVWKALTDKNELEKWCFKPDEFKPEVGFTFRISQDGSGLEQDAFCKVINIEIEKKIEYTFKFEDMPDEMLVSFELIDIDGKTQLKLVHSGFENLPAQKKDEFRDIWSATLNCLKNSVEGTVKLIADITLFCKDEVLMTRYSDTNQYDHQEGWFLPDDIVNYLEHPGEAAVRILKEQLNYDTDGLTLGFIESFTGGDRSWHLAFHYRKDLSEKPDLQPDRNIKQVQWFKLDNLPDRQDVAHHGWALFTIESLKG